MTPPKRATALPEHPLSHTNDAVGFNYYDQDLSRPLGLHRVLEPHGVLPQPAWKLDNTPIVHAAGTPMDVDTLHIAIERVT